MKVTAVLGSPRKKGDCFHVLQMMEQSFEKAGSVEMEYLYLNDLALGFCKSCLLCYKKGEQYCPHKEITTMLLDKMLASDVVIFACPVYEQQVTALMKNFYDNFSFLFHRPRFFGKKAIIVSSTGGSGLKGTLNYMKMNAIGWGFQIAGEIGVCGNTLKTDRQYQETVQKNIDQITGHLKQSREPSPSFYQLALFRAMQKKAAAGAGKDDLAYAYWKNHGWFHKMYYTDARIGFFKTMYSRILAHLMKHFISADVLIAKS